MTEWRFEWSGGRGAVQALGGMATASFALPDGRSVDPFAVAPWSDDTGAAYDALPGILKGLRGTWPCVPFGVPEVRRDLPSRWTDGLGEDLATDPTAHGISSNFEWQRDGAAEGGLSLSIAYPEGHPVERLAQEVRGDGNTLTTDLHVTMREEAALPMGFHPTLRLPEAPGSARLVVPGGGRVFAYPAEVEPVISWAAIDAVGADLTAVPRQGGGVFDASRLPFEGQAEELLLVEAHGHARLENRAEAYAVDIRWDADLFPMVMLWLSLGGRRAYPWNGRFRAIGIEPICGAFDLGVVHSQRRANPIARAGHKTVVALSPAQALRTSCQISVSPLP